MVAAYVSSSTAPAYTGATTSLILTKPASVAANDVLIGVIHLETPAVPAGFTLPTGWTLESSVSNALPLTVCVLWKRAGSSEPSTYTFSWTGGAWSTGTIHRFTGAQTTGNPLSGTVGVYTDVATLPSQSYTTTGPGRGIWLRSSYNDDVTITTPTGYTQRDSQGLGSLYLADRADTAGTKTTGTVVTGGGTGQVEFAATVLDDTGAAVTQSAAATLAVTASFAAAAPTGIAYAGTSTAPNYVGGSGATAILLDRTTGTMGTTSANDLLIAALHLEVSGLPPVTAPTGWTSVTQVETTSPGGTPIPLWSEAWAQANGTSPTTVTTGLSGAGSSAVVQSGQLRLTSGTATGGGRKGVTAGRDGRCRRRRPHRLVHPRLDDR